MYNIVAYMTAKIVELLKKQYFYDCKHTYVVKLESDWYL